MNAFESLRSTEGTTKHYQTTRKKALIFFHITNLVNPSFWQCTICQLHVLQNGKRFFRGSLRSPCLLTINVQCLHVVSYKSDPHALQKETREHRCRAGCPANHQAAVMLLSWHVLRRRPRDIAEHRLRDTCQGRVEG